MVWWKEASNQGKLLDAAKNHKTPLYVYHLPTIREQMNKLLSSLTSVDLIHYAFKANDNSDILRAVHVLNNKIGFECVSIEEVNYLIELIPELPRHLIFFSPNFCAKEEYAQALDLGVRVNVDCLYPLENWSEIFKNKKICLRMDSGVQHGHHEFVKTASVRSKFGISPADLNKISEISAKYGVQVQGLHSHVGSGILETQVWAQNLQFLGSLLTQFPFLKENLEFINIGGGLGVVENPTVHTTLDLQDINSQISKEKEKLHSLKKDVAIHLEPGRYVVAEAGVLLCKVTQLKQKEEEKWYVGCNAGFNSLLRPALYQSWHEIVNLTRYSDYTGSRMIKADIVGQICETGDVLGKDRMIPESTTSGDVLVIGTAGAYGHTMALLSYNRREPAKELVIE